MLPCKFPLAGWQNYCCHSAWGSTYRISNFQENVSPNLGDSVTLLCGEGKGQHRIRGGYYENAFFVYFGGCYADYRGINHIQCHDSDTDTFVVFQPVETMSVERMGTLSKYSSGFRISRARARVSERERGWDSLWFEFILGFIEALTE